MYIYIYISHVGHGDTLSFPLAQAAGFGHETTRCCQAHGGLRTVSCWRRRQVHRLAPSWRPKSWWTPLRTSQLAHQQYEQLSPNQDHQLPKLWISNVFWLYYYKFTVWTHVGWWGVFSTEKIMVPSIVSLTHKVPHPVHHCRLLRPKAIVVENGWI